MKNYIILMPWGRVGSNLVMDYIYQTLKGRARCGNEILNGASSSREQIARLQAFYHPSEDLDFKVTKESLGCMEDVSIIDAALQSEGVSIIKMSRRSILKTAISQLRAEAYAEHSKQTTGTAMWGVDHDAKPLGAITIDLVKLEELCTVMLLHNKRLDKMGHHSKSINVYYEDLLENMPQELARISDFMGFAPVAFTPRFRKATSDNLSESVKNYADVVAWAREKHIA